VSNIKTDLKEANSEVGSNRSECRPIAFFFNYESSELFGAVPQNFLINFLKLETSTTTKTLKVAVYIHTLSPPDIMLS
jgi:hypothetical protein